MSMRMVADAGATLVEMGHSERRESFGETNETVAHKARAAIDHGLVPLICVGEPWSVREAGDATEFVTRQVAGALAELTPDEVSRVLLAYEPIWAIGVNGRPATPEEVEPTMAIISSTLLERSDGRGIEALLYGGSVNQQNAAELLKDASTDGLFIGRSAWDVDGLLALLAIGRAHLKLQR